MAGERRRLCTGTRSAPIAAGRQALVAGLIGSEPGPAAEYVKSHASCARDIMTRDVITVREDTPIAEIATVLETHRIKRVPVLRRERLVGIVSRATSFRRSRCVPAPQAWHARSDDSIRRQLLTELERQPWWRSSASNVIVTDGIVHYWGIRDYGDQPDAARVAAENVPGVRKVEDHRMRIADMPQCFDDFLPNSKWLSFQGDMQWHVS